MEFLSERREVSKLKSVGKGAFFLKLRATAAITMLLASTAPTWALGQQTQQPPTTAQATTPAAAPANAQQTFPTEPAPNFTQPLYMRDTPYDFSKPRGYWPNPIAPYKPLNPASPRFSNSVRLDDLVKNGKIYLSMSDAVLLALENNYDIAIQRLTLDIADTDIMRAKSGSNLLLGVSSGLVTNTLGGAGTTVTGGGGPGGTSAAVGGAGTGTGGQALTTSGTGPAPGNFDPALTGSIELQRQTIPQSTPAFAGAPALSQNTNQYNFNYAQDFITGTNLKVGFNNSYQTTANVFAAYSPQLSSTFNAQITQHLLYGFGWGVNGRFIVQAKNDRRIADSAFRQQLLFTINQIENIYWGLVSAYEDLQAKNRALQQSSQLASDNEKQLQIGTLAPLDVVSANSAVEQDKQAVIASQSNLEYQQLVMKQAIARSLEDPTLANAPVIPTDRISLIEMPEERRSADDLVRQADANSPAIEQSLLAIKNDEITLKGAKSGLLPTLDVYGFYGASALGGSQNPNCVNFGASGTVPCPPGQYPSVDYSTTFSNLFNSSGPNKGVGFNLSVPIRNRFAQSVQERSELEYRQAQMRLQQLYVQTRMNVVNAQFALTNDRAAVQSALATRDYDQQSLDAELKKLHLGASTTALVLQQQRALAIAENTVISSTAKYAIDRAALGQILAATLDRFGISITEAATGNISQAPIVPGLQPAKSLPEVTLPAQQQNLQQQEQRPVPEPQARPQSQPLPPQPTQPQPQPH
ncbi:TolC family protein [Alloacidobacterium dinghuense]|uniref:TolC family protein n=1 Tax=Alloacidobacterium dinghuense TaxID=2763107 RepID=A0A7G8BN99_9BACT|nr:TolC family protein [Alloacidobacterium dinghuense]QNI34019.1 TolC family protein [Alloacidobacterium dinghuense]